MYKLCKNLPLRACFPCLLTQRVNTTFPSQAACFREAVKSAATSEKNATICLNCCASSQLIVLLKIVIIIPKTSTLAEIALVSVFTFFPIFFLPTISALLCLLTGLGSHTLVAFRSVSSKRSASCSWRHGNKPRGNPGGGTVPFFQWSFEIKNAERRNTSRFCLPSFHDVIPFCHSHWP